MGGFGLGRFGLKFIWYSNYPADLLERHTDLWRFSDHTLRNTAPNDATKQQTLSVTLNLYILPCIVWNFGGISNPLVLPNQIIPFRTRSKLATQRHGRFTSHRQDNTATPYLAPEYRSPRGHKEVSQIINIVPYPIIYNLASVRGGTGLYYIIFICFRPQ